MNHRAWGGDYFFLLGNLMQKDFKIRYRNMSLGVFWSLLNPLVTMGVLTFVFTFIFPSGQQSYPVFFLCGLVPFNFFSFAWSTGTQAIVEGTSFVKRVGIPREIIPLASVLSNCLHLVIQIGLLLFFVLLFHFPVTRYWFWLPVIWFFYILFVSGLVMVTSALNVFIRDIRYLVESFNAVLFWLLPIVYDQTRIPPQFRDIYSLNPVAAVILALRNVLMEQKPPQGHILQNLAWSSSLVFVAGFFSFRAMKRNFYDYL